MNNNTNYLKDISEMRSIMERSAKFLSLSGLCGICAGFTALIGALVAYYFLDYQTVIFEDYRSLDIDRSGFGLYLILDAIFVLLLALGFSLFFSIKKAKEKEETLWNSSAKRLFINLIIPLLTGGFFCIILFFQKNFSQIVPATLIFYGLALFSAAKYTFHEIRYLGIIEIVLGLIAMIFVKYGLLFWVFGFGLLHIIYGFAMYYRYERS
jgi:hypothetical protein